MSGFEALIAAQVGSRMYGLETEDSDYDYALFGTERPEGPYGLTGTCALLEGLDRIDGLYRHVDKLLWMADYSCVYHLAYLFSEKTVAAPKAAVFWRELRAMGEDLATANLRRFRELSFARLNVTRARALGQPYGNDNKALMHTLFYCNLLQTFAGGAPYAESIRQDTGTLLALRRGQMPEAEARDLVDRRLRGLNTEAVARFYRRPKDRAALRRLEALSRDSFHGADKERDG